MAFVINPPFSGFSRKTWGKGFTYLQGRTHVLTGTVAHTCGKRGSALQGRMQCTAGAVAVHCGSGCSALRLRWVKLAPKSSVLFWIRDKGGETHPIRVSVAPRFSGSVEKHGGKEFHKRCLYTIFSPQTFTMADANVYDGGCKRLRERMQTFAVKRGCALQGRMQCTAGAVAVHYV